MASRTQDSTAGIGEASWKVLCATIAAEAVRGKAENASALPVNDCTWVRGNDLAAWSVLLLEVFPSPTCTSDMLGRFWMHCLRCMAAHEPAGAWHDCCCFGIGDKGTSRGFKPLELQGRINFF